MNVSARVMIPISHARNFAGALALALCGTVGASASAAEMEFLGTTIDPAAGQYLVGADANVRDSPATNAKRIGKLEEGEIVDVVGKASGTAWYAVRQGETPLGFVYATLLTPIIDGELDEDVTGELQVQLDLRCGYRIHFIGKTDGGSDVIPTADYEASIVCERRGKRIRFPAQMFITEVPFDRSNTRRVFQINVDLLDGVHSLIDIFSTTMLFNLDEGRVLYDQMTEKTFERPKVELNALPATNIPRALGSAMELALRHWSEAAWDDIFSSNG